MKLINSLVNKCRNDIFLIVVVYFIAFGPVLLNDGIFFDDWAIFHIDNATIMKQMWQVGMPWLGYYNIIIFSFNNMLVCRALVFFCYLFSALLLYGVLKTVKEIGNRERFFITLFFILFPVNFARLPQSTSHYAISYFLFFLGLFLLSLYFLKRKIFVRISALSFLFLSFFSLPSLLLFYGVVILFIAYVECPNIKTIKGYLFFPLRYLDFLVAPVVFWAIKIIFFKPYGLYAGHNEVNLTNLLTSIYKLNVAFSASFIAPLKEAFQSSNSIYLTTIIATLLVSVFIYKRYPLRQDDKAGTKDFWFLSLGFFVFLLGVYGYLVVDKMPISSSWYSRFQILVPLGASFIIVYFVRIIFNNKIRTIVYSLLLVLFVHTNFMAYLNYQKDWFKQLSLIENFKNSEILRNNSSFLFNDRTFNLDARGRTYYFYEYTGLMKLVFGNERRFGTVNPSDFVGGTERYIKFSSYNCREYNMQKPQYEVVIDYGQYKLGYSNTIKLILLKFIKSAKFKEKIKNVIRLEYVKL